MEERIQRGDVVRGHEVRRIHHQRIRSTFTFETARFVALYGSFSVVLHLTPDERAHFLSELTAIIDRDFGGRVERPLTTNLYIAQS